MNSPKKKIGTQSSMWPVGFESSYKVGPDNIDLLIDQSDSLEKLDRNEEVRNKDAINWCE